MDQDTTWYGGTPRPSHILLDGDPARRLHANGHSSPHPTFWPTALARILQAHILLITRIVN